MPRGRPAVWPNLRKPKRGRRDIVPPDQGVYSTFPFSDGFPWDEPLIRFGARAVSTNGPSWRQHESPIP